jgi:hypothetical protein
VGIIAIILIGAILNALLAGSKGRNRGAWALWGAIAPLVSLLILALLPKVEAGAACPFCAELILPAAQVCRHCGRDLPAGWSAPKVEIY